MALLWCDGFDHYGTDKTNMTDGAWAELGSSHVTISGVNPRTGTNSMQMNTTSALPGANRRVLGGAKTTVGLGSAWWFSNLPTSTARLYGFRDAANAVQLTITLQSTGIISVERGGSTFLGDSVTPAVTAEAYTHIEAQVTMGEGSPATGEVEVRVNGVTVVSLVGVDTIETANPETSQVTIGPFGSTPGDASTGITTLYYDDLFCYDDTGAHNNDFIGDRRVVTLFPDADTAQADWSWNIGPNAFSTINDIIPDDDTTYIFANPGGSPSPVSEFDMQDLPVGVTAISGVLVVNRMRKTDAGVADVTPGIVSGSSEKIGATHALTEAYTYYHEVVEVDPDTAAPFTPTALNAAKLKVDRTL